MNTIGRIGVLILWMHTLTLVRSKDCQRESFLRSRLYDSNFDISTLESTYANRREVRVPCNIGHSGFFKLVCNDGEWTSKGKPCRPISCGHPGDAQFAEFQLVEGEDFVFGSKVVYTCHKGYQMVSRINYRRCFVEGWDGVVPVCEAQQCPFIRVDNNVFVNGDPEEATFGNVIRFSCKSKLDILEGPSEIYCNEEGEWSGRAPKCKKLMCLVPEIENGYITEEAREYSENEILYFSCNEKFKRREDRPSKCTKVGMRAEWSPTPECEPTKCVLQLPPLKGTTYEPAFKSVFVPGETLRVTCEGRFWIFSSRETVAETTCNDDGQWTINPVCKEVVCTNEREYNVRRWDVWWGQRIVMGATVEYSCIADYESSDGSNLAKCTREGWKPKPLCQEIICHRMDIENAVNRDPYSLTYKNNKRVYYECREGFTGSPFRTCTANGWTGDSRCTEITCNRKYYSYAVIEGTDKSVYKYNEQVDYVCNNGYVGRFTLTCGKGRWKGTQSCMRKPCNRPELMDANIRGADKQSYSNNEKIQYVCTYSQEVREAKCEEGVWTGITKCSACPKAVIPHGFAVGAQGDKLTYTCDEGYKLFNKGWWGEATCVNHLWSGLEQCIGEMQCGEIPAIANGEALTIQKPYDENESTEIRCNEGFEAQVTRLSCHEGEWSSDGSQLNTICTARASNCDAPPKVDNAIITTTYKNNYLTDSEVVYECRNKYMLVGEGSLRCLGRKWEEKNITCALYCDLPKDHTITFKVHKDRFVDGEVLQYQCSENGEYLNATCVDGKWDKTVECDEITCNRKYFPYAVIEGTAKSVYKYNEQVDYVCNNGYVGRFTLTCGKGRWKGTQSCMRKPCNRPELMDANIRGVVKQSYSNNDKIQYDCTNSQEVHEAKCEEGVWTGITNCSELKCLVPEIENGYITEEASEYRENEILYFRCNRTFKRREDRPSKCTKVGMRAEWSPTPECEPTKCVLQLPPLEGTTYEPAFKSVFVPGETLRVTCEGRFWIFSSRETVAETTCNDDGQWTINPVCKEVVCTNEREYNVRRWDVWWGQRIVMGDTVEYSCIADYESSDGSNLAKCTREGWKPKPLCQEIICHRMDIENAVNRDPYSLTYKNNKRVYYECREGFTGSPFRTCTANGWTGDSRCTEITCNRKYFPYAVIEGTAKSVYKYNEQVDYVCNNGYVGRFTLTCGKGRWKGTQSCMRKPCNRPELMDANIRGAVKQSYSNNEKIQYVCTYSQEVHEAKCEEGVWTGITNCSEAEGQVNGSPPLVLFLRLKTRHDAADSR
ncbi:complement factor H isoform X5 [Takifugu rubripes]|uniref:complement factor H isoform X5 n=1 Tax=Takifugu rubripes TaxID=31033 RepID=UPI001145ADD3|nr:complement factor H isoform X5 [Takifugu rubripes]